MTENRQNSVKTWTAVFVITSIVIGIAIISQLSRYGKEGAIVNNEIDACR